MIQEFINSVRELLGFCSVYYTIQLVRCAMISLVVSAAVLLLRKTPLRDRVFLKGALWSLFIPVLFVGKMKFFYENPVGVALFSWWTGILIRRQWIGGLYFLVVLVYAVRLFYRRRKLKKLAEGMERRQIAGVSVYVTEFPVTPYTAGVLRPRIVMPRIILEQYSEEECKAILLHEKEHIRLGHLILYFLWDVLRVLLWPNPLLAAGTKYFREDMEEICDWTTIQKGGTGAYEYGQLLIRTMRLLQTESRNFNMYATFAGDKEYRNIRQRVGRIVGYRPYRRGTAAGALAAALLCAAVAVAGIKTVSYARYNEYGENDAMIVYAFDGKNVTFYDSGVWLHQIISYDDRYVYVRRKEFESYLHRGNATGDIFIVFGGFYKLPGVGGKGCSCCYEAEGGEEIVKIPYDSQEGDWRVRLLKIL